MIFPLPAHILQAIAQIFVHHGMHHYLGAGILHRHQTLQDGEVMVHTERSQHLDISKIQSINNLDSPCLVPNSYFLNHEHQFQAFEYDINKQAVNISLQFASELRDFLLTNNLQDRLAIIPSPAIEGGLNDSIEFMLPNGIGTIRIPLSEVKSAGIEPNEAITTGWSFTSNDQGIIECKGNSVCAPQTNGKHRVFVDTKLRGGIVGI